MRTVEAEPETHYALSNAAADVPLEELVRARFTRHKIEEVFGTAKGEVGLAQYEVRSWVGWHHHITLSILADAFRGSRGPPYISGSTPAAWISVLGRATWGQGHGS